jgi:hypothetical protein
LTDTSNVRVGVLAAAALAPPAPEAATASVASVVNLVLNIGTSLLSCSIY